MSTATPKTPARPYWVHDSKTLEDFLIRATNQPQAISFVMRKRLTAEPASPEKVAELYENGIRIQDARSEPDPDSLALTFGEAVANDARDAQPPAPLPIDGSKP